MIGIYLPIKIFENQNRRKKCMKSKKSDQDLESIENITYLNNTPNLHCWKCGSEEIEESYQTIGKEKNRETDKSQKMFYCIKKTCEYKFFPWQDKYFREIMFNDKRNLQIVQLAIKFIKLKQRTLIYVGMRQHSIILKELISCSLREHLMPPSVLSTAFGGMNSVDLNEETKKNLIEGKVLCVISTSVWGEGFNVPQLRWCIYAKAGGPGIEIEQVLGRMIRTAPGKFRAGFIFFQDHHHEMFDERSRGVKRYLIKKTFTVTDLKEQDGKYRKI